MSVLTAVQAPFKEVADSIESIYLDQHGINRPFDSERKIYGFFTPYQRLADVRGEIKAPLSLPVITLVKALGHTLRALYQSYITAVHIASLFDLRNARTSFGQAVGEVISVACTAIVGTVYFIAATIKFVTRTLTSILVGLFSLGSAVKNCFGGGAERQREHQYNERQDLRCGEYRDDNTRVFEDAFRPEERGFSLA